MDPKLKTYISASKNEYLSEAQQEVKQAIHDEVRNRSMEPWGYYAEGPLRYDWGCAEASTAMAQADGAIVLGFARWECKGIGPRNENGLKVSEGNHVEGGLAIAHGIPLLVIKEEGTQERGILVADFNHAVVHMPHGSLTDWVRDDKTFKNEFGRWYEKVTQRAKIMKRQNVFIGHGHSPVWRELKDYLRDRLHLPCDEFNSVTPAGKMVVERLSEMLDQAAVAFLIMTAEDEQSNGALHARMNVVHEAGLMQGKLGFQRAIILLEEGCEIFSNINGLNHIPFPKGHIRAAFEEIRHVLEREGLLPSGDSA